MKKRNLVSVAVVGLVFAVIGSVLVGIALVTRDCDFASIAGALNLLLGAAAAICAAAGILGTAPTRRALGWPTVLLSAVAYLGFDLSTPIGCSFAGVSGDTVSTVTTVSIAWIIVGVVGYLAAATFYGFAGTAQGVTVGARIGLLLLLLLAVVPGANVLGLIGILITVLVRANAARPGGTAGDRDAADAEGPTPSAALQDSEAQRPDSAE